MPTNREFYSREANAAKEKPDKNCPRKSRFFQELRIIVIRIGRYGCRRRRIEHREDHFMGAKTRSQ